MVKSTAPGRPGSSITKLEHLCAGKYHKACNLPEGFYPTRNPLRAFLAWYTWGFHERSEARTCSFHHETKTCKCVRCFLPCSVSSHPPKCTAKGLTTLSHTAALGKASRLEASSIISSSDIPFLSQQPYAHTKNESNSLSIRPFHNPQAADL